MTSRKTHSNSTRIAGAVALVALAASITIPAVAAQAAVARSVVLIPRVETSFADSTLDAPLLFDGGDVVAALDRPHRVMRVFDASGDPFTELAAVPVGADPVDAAADAVGQRVVVLDDVGTRLLVIDVDQSSPTANTVVDEITLPRASSQQVAIDSAAGIAYVTNYDLGVLYSFDLDTGAQAEIAVGEAPRGVAVDEVSHAVYILSGEGTVLSRIEGGAVTDTAAVRGEGLDIAVAEGLVLVDTLTDPATPEFMLDAYDELLDIVASSNGYTERLPFVAVDATAAVAYVTTALGDVKPLRFPELSDEGYASILPAPVFAVSVDPESGVLYASSRLGRASRLGSYDAQLSPVARPPRSATAELGLPFTFPVTWAARPAVSSYTLSSGELPPGLVLNSSTGEITGSPAVLGTWRFEVTVDNGTPFRPTGSYAIVVDGGEGPAITSGPPHGATVGVPYTFQLTATGSPAPRFEVSFGSLPAGLTLNGRTGVISGTPTTAGDATFSISASNVAGGTTAEYRMSVAAAPTPTPTPTPSPTPTPGPTPAPSPTPAPTTGPGGPSAPGGTNSPAGGGSGSLPGGTRGGSSGALARTGASPLLILVAPALALLVAGSTVVAARRHRTR